MSPIYPFWCYSQTSCILFLTTIHNSLPSLSVIIYMVDWAQEGYVWQLSLKLDHIWAHPFDNNSYNNSSFSEGDGVAPLSTKVPFLETETFTYDYVYAAWIFYLFFLQISNTHFAQQKLLMVLGPLPHLSTSMATTPEDGGGLVGWGQWWPEVAESLLLLL